MQHGPKNFKKLIVHFGYNTYVLDLSSVPISLVKNDQYNPFPFVDNSVEIKKTSEVSVSIHMFAVDIYLSPDLLQIKLDQVFKNKVGFFVIFPALAVVC